MGALIVFTLLVNNILYTLCPRNVENGYSCLKYNEKDNTCQWKQMGYSYVNEDLCTFNTTVEENDIVYYKFKFIFRSKTVETSWEKTLINYDLLESNNTVSIIMGCVSGSLLLFLVLIYIYYKKYVKKN